MEADRKDENTREHRHFASQLSRRNHMPQESKQASTLSSSEHSAPSPPEQLIPLRKAEQSRAKHSTAEQSVKDSTQRVQIIDSRYTAKLPSGVRNCGTLLCSLYLYLRVSVLLSSSTGQTLLNLETSPSVLGTTSDISTLSSDHVKFPD